MKNRLEFDTFMISLGLASLVLQWGLDRQDKLSQAKARTELVQASAGPYVNYTAPTAAKGQGLTFPPDSPYQNLHWPDSATANPFTQVSKIAAENAGISNWAGKDTDLRLLLKAHEGHPYYFVLQQQAANEMLRHDLFQHYYQDPTAVGMLEGISFYTQQLVQAGSEDAKLMYMCLRALKEYWPKEKIAQAAQTTARRIQRRSLSSSADSAYARATNRQVYARELQKMAEKMSGGKK